MPCTFELPLFVQFQPQHIGVLSMYAIIIAVLVVCVLVTTFTISETQAKPESDLKSLGKFRRKR